VNVSCALCQRTLLPGELYRLFRGDYSRDHSICALCEPDALNRYWLKLDRPASRVRVHDLATTVRTAA
jgi:hypothetical protein